MIHDSHKNFFLGLNDFNKKSSSLNKVNEMGDSIKDRSMSI